MADHSKEIEYEDLIITDGNGEKLFELRDVGVLSVEGSKGLLTVELEMDEDPKDGRSVFKTE